VRLNVQPGIAGAGAIGALVGMSAAKALSQAPITMTNEATNLCADNQCMPFLVALPRVSLGPCVIQVQSAVFGCHPRGTMNRKTFAPRI
jgi:hypothetical protein